LPLDVKNAVKAKMVDIIIVKSDPIMNTPTLRDQKIVRSLRKKYSIIGLGWNRRGQGTTMETTDSDIDVRLFKVKGVSNFESHGTLRYLPYMLVFWMWVFIKLCKYRPKIIHACNLDSFFPAYIYKVLFRKKIVFDVFDRYAMAYIPKDRNVFFSALYSFVNRVEEEFARRSDVLINISDEMLTTYKKRPKYCVTIMNCSEDYTRNRLKVEQKGLKLLFTGHLRRGRGLELLLDIVKNLRDTQLIITGRVEDKGLLNSIAGFSNIIYKGFLDHSQVLDLEATSDVMIALYDLDLQIQNKYVMGNKLFEAMMFGVPIITNVAKAIVSETDCGLIVDYKDIEQIKEAIIILGNSPELRKRLGANGRKAFLEKYNWNIMEQRLYTVYEDLLKLQT
jgi:glycosyltransferase involved in cell wall biosynthesis